MRSGPRRIIRNQDDISLKKIATPVAPEEFSQPSFQQLVSELETVKDEVTDAMGLSAPQIGHPKRVITTGLHSHDPKRPNVQPFPKTTFVNPELVSSSEEREQDWESCASCDKPIFTLVYRPLTIQFKAQDTQGKPFQGTLRNFQARAFLHELDHLNGVSIYDKAEVIKEYDDEKGEPLSFCL